MSEEDPTELERRLLSKLRQTKRKHFLLERLVSGLDASNAEIEAALDDLVDRGEVVRTRKGRVALASRLGLITGTLRVNRRGRALVIPDEADAPVRLHRSNVRPAMDGDRVLVEAEPYTKRGLRDGKIRQILERGRTTLIGTVRPAGDAAAVLVPSDPRIGYVATLSEDSAVPDPGMVVEAAIVDYPTSFRDPIVRVGDVLGSEGTLPTEIEAVCRSMGIATEFDPAAIREAEQYDAPGPSACRDRADLRDQATFTIDPADAADFDDAVSIQHGPGGYRLTVSIADVSHYVVPGGPLDAEAYHRGTSTYFPGRCVPMLPEAISADLASLKPNRDRLAISVFLEVDQHGSVRSAEFARSVIHSDGRFTYEEVEEILGGGGKSVDPAIVETIQDMAECARRLRRQRAKRGAIDLDVPEATIELDSRGAPAAIVRKPRLTSHRIVEEFMLAANEAVARKLDDSSIGFLFRIHQRPDEESITSLVTRLRLLGFRLKHDGAMLEPSALQVVIDAAAGGAFARQVSVLVLRAMKQARYSAYKDLHFGLASQCYTHFTSPIRRYPDLVVHRALCALLEGRTDRLASAEALEPTAEHCSRRERKAVDAERDVARAAAVLYMQPHLGDRFDGTVTGVERYGFYVELDEAFVEGFVPVGRLREYYEYVPDRLELQSRSSGHCVRIGDRCSVTVEAAELSERRLEFGLVEA